MLWVNGYSGKTSQFLKLTPKTGRPYWAKNLNAASVILKDWNRMFIDPDLGLFTSPASRFKSGYHFALENERTIRNNILLSGNMLHIVAHGKGIAFAEGISAYFYEEKGIVTDLAIYLKVSDLAATPQSRRAVDCRIVFESKAESSAKSNKNLKFKDVVITEKDLDNGFCKYSVTLTGRDCDHKTSHLYFKGSLSSRRFFNLSKNKPFALWSSVEHAIKMYVESEVDHYTGKMENVRNPMFEKFSMN